MNAATVGRAIAIGKYAIGHARRAFAEMGADGKIEDAKFLLAWLAKSGETTFTKRDAHRAAQARFKTIDDVEPVLNLLEDHGYIRAQPTDERIGAGRKPSPRYDVNPLITPNSVNSVNSVTGESEPKNETESASTDPVGSIPSDRIDRIDRMKDTSPNGHIVDPTGIGLNGAAPSPPPGERSAKSGPLGSIPLGVDETDDLHVAEPPAIGDMVNLFLHDGTLVYAVPRRVRSVDVYPKDGTTWIHVDGSETGWLADQVEVVERARSAEMAG